MIVKSPILPKRVRKVPRSFSWIDHRLIRDRHIDLCSHSQAALYLFLVCAADEKGLSYYGDGSIMAKLGMDPHTLEAARSGLIQNSLIAWQKPIYQVLSLEPQESRTGSMMRLKDILGGAK
ncbi:hypothetical protein CEE37_15110 [candidate division LCP-89 bacterium B3_LCP]|uniref:Uncharacterized protein n=1 Tax=candidate division LCP-89 bacterium B3_LCP TaxID=2012998 RepID=A0A532UN65_UNCL8|nr:MAG: hypothetical protein CEE37_15110 [candidate division LCP-89 bacterium B3_LCP]